MSEDFDLTTKGGRIAYVLAASGHTPSSISRVLGCAPAAVYQWIDGSTKNLKEPFLWALADATGFEARWISTGEGDERVDIPIRHVTSMMQAMEPKRRYMAERLIQSITNDCEGKDDET
jgi:hypothetical protein